MDVYRIPKVDILWNPPDGRRGRPRNTWRRTFIKDLEQLGVPWDEAEEAAVDRVRWRALVARYAN